MHMGDGGGSGVDGAAIRAYVSRVHHAMSGSLVAPQTFIEMVTESRANLDHMAEDFALTAVKSVREIGLYMDCLRGATALLSPALRSVSVCRLNEDISTRLVWAGRGALPSGGIPSSRNVQIDRMLLLAGISEWILSLTSEVEARADLSISGSQIILSLTPAPLSENERIWAEVFIRRAGFILKSGSGCLTAASGSYS